MAAAAVSASSTSSQGEASSAEQMGTSSPAPSQVASPVRQSLLLRGRKSGYSCPATSPEVKAQTTEEMRTPDRRKTAVGAKETPKKRAAPKKRDDAENLCRKLCRGCHSLGQEGNGADAL
ncbi:unnamed protein product [Symbiodinium necroappetens]|uniref:Uncharacterized protein n=1 Tax=Symbiodinium necroappetens TaxID=1628268 RepID=A0A813AUK3_9DINO|nr:unnamed protein product [Symbiodinium necroappetens]